MLMDREQLDTMKRQLEDEYRLDLAAIERLQRRFNNGAGIAAAAASTVYMTPVSDKGEMRGTKGEVRGTELPGLEPRAEAQPDELTGTLRAIFSAQSRAVQHR